MISLTKLISGDELSRKIAEISPPDLRKGCESIRVAQMDDFKRPEHLFETGEVSEQKWGLKDWYGQILTGGGNEKNIFFWKKC